MDYKQSLTELVSAKDINTESKVLIDEEMISETEIEKINKQKLEDRNSYLDSLKKGLAAQDDYLLAVDNGEMQKVGLPETTPSASTTEPTPKVENAEYTEEDEEEEAPEKEINFSEFIPDYAKKDEDSDEESEEETEASNDSGKRYGSLPVQTLDHEENVAVDSFLVKKEPTHLVENIKRNKSDVMSDKSFVTALNKIKKSSFSTSTLPLINSGFFAEVQGGGIIDILQLYRDKLADTTSIEYDIDRLKTIIRSIKSTTPLVDPMQIMASIHESDYQLLALAYASATLKTFVIPHTCQNPKCKKDFKIEVLPVDTIMNIDEINEKVYEIRNADDYRKTSLLDSDKRVTLNCGAIAVIGHPTFMDYLHRIDSVKRLIEKDEEEGYKFASNVKVISMIRSIELPNGIKTANAYQIYKAMSLFDEEDFDTINRIVIDMQKEIIIPKFGIKTVKCPVCGEENTNIEIGNIDDLVFYHIMATQF